MVEMNYRDFILTSKLGKDNSEVAKALLRIEEEIFENIFEKTIIECLNDFTGNCIKCGNPARVLITYMSKEKSGHTGTQPRCYKCASDYISKMAQEYMGHYEYFSGKDN